jgi:hypothetical protein
MRQMILLALAVIPFACATGAGNVDPNTPETCVTFDNREGGTLGQLYLVSEGQEIPLLRGTLEAGTQARHCVQRSNSTGFWRLESRDPSLIFPSQRRAWRSRNQSRPRPVPSTRVYVSPDFVFDPGDEIRWDTFKNYIYVNGMRVGGL